MQLSNDQIVFYNENGYLRIENYLTEKEVDTLYAELPKTIESNSPRVIFEDNGTIRSIFAPHFVSNIYMQLSKLGRFVIPAEQLLGSKVYLHQYKVNTKQGLKGEWWEWHQDFPYWHIDDGIKNPELITVLLYLQDTDATNGALLLIPKSHKLGIAKFADKNSTPDPGKENCNIHEETKEYLSSLSKNIKFTVHNDLIKQMTRENGIITVSGKKGSVLFFHANIFHASNINLTPFDRDAVLITYNSVNNVPFAVQKPRPEFLAGRDYRPIEDVVILIRNNEYKGERVI